MQEKVKVRLLSITENMEELIDLVWDVAKTDTPLDELEEKGITNEVDKILTADLPVAEYVNMVWSIEGLPRTFWDQIDRCRTATFWEQSVRIIDCSKFAVDDQYWLTSATNKPLYHQLMKISQDTYNALLQEGVPSEEARGVLPLHLIVRGTMAINLRALRKMIASRTCFIAQGGYWRPVIEQMADELRDQLPTETFNSMFRLPCYGCSECPIASNVKTRLTDEDPNPVCPVYINKYVGNKRAALDIAEKKHPDYAMISMKFYEYLNKLKKEDVDA